MNSSTCRSFPSLRLSRVSSRQSRRMFSRISETRASTGARSMIRQRESTRLRAAMSPPPPPDLLALAGLGLLLGLRHALEPDHLAAVSTLATRQGRLLDACRLGLAWALGHTASVGAVVGAIILFGLRLPDRLWPAAALLVAVLLIGLGGSVILRYARGRWHLHMHSHAGGPHLHLHSHAQGTAHEHAHPQGDARRLLGFGLLHGLAGSAAILVLLVAAAPTRAAQLAYFGAFAAGTMLGMLVGSVSLASIVRLASTRGVRWATLLLGGSAAAGLAAGPLLAGPGAGAVPR